MFTSVRHPSISPPALVVSAAFLRARRQRTKRATLRGSGQAVIPKAHARRPCRSPRYSSTKRVALGLGHVAIAERLGTRAKNVRNGVSTILVKLQAEDRAEAVRPGSASTSG